jgi:hypothetical protein
VLLNWSRDPTREDAVDILVHYINCYVAVVCFGFDLTELKEIARFVVFVS